VCPSIEHHCWPWFASATFLALPLYHPLYFEERQSGLFENRTAGQSVAIRADRVQLDEVRALVEPFDPRALVYPWRNRDAELDRLAAAIQDTIKREERRQAGRGEIFRLIWNLAQAGDFPQTPLPA
jgi:hypothetical protein